MKIPIACAACLAATVSWGQVITNDLVLYLDANVDTDGSDGWDFTQPAVPGGGGTLPLVNPANVPTNQVETEGGRYYRATGDTQAFGGPVPTNAVYSFSYEIWLRVNGLGYVTQENAIGAWRKSEDFIDNRTSIFMGADDFRDIDLDTTSFSGWTHPEPIGPPSGTRWIFKDQANLGLDKWHQVVFTYQDATDFISSNGVLNVYLNGDPTPVSVVTGVDLYNMGSASAPDHAELGYASVFMIAAGEANRNLEGDIAIVRLYRDVLAPAEVTQNFDAHKDLYPFAGPQVALMPTNIPDLMEIQLETVNGVIYELERSADVAAPSNTWVSTDSFIRGDGATMRMYDKTDANNPGFNRISVSAP